MEITAIRGATTADSDTKEDIEMASIELLNEILSANNMTAADLIYIQISSTVDLKSYYPATALRLSGCNVPLFSCLEPDIDSSLKKCIRFLCLSKLANEPKHIYLKKAANLRVNKGE